MDTGKISLVLGVVLAIPAAGSAQTGKLWELLEWGFDNPSYTGNPFDLMAAATFTHTAGGEQIATELFYDGGTTTDLETAQQNSYEFDVT